jgi:hypothetical protein
MKLTPKMIRKLHSAASKYEDDAFFGVRSHDHKFFICNWVFGLCFDAEDVMNCPHVQTLEDETARICIEKPDYQDIIRHIYNRSWLDILVGTGIYQDAHLVQLQNDERHVFEQRGWNAIPFETDGGRRFYIRETYFDIAEEAIGEDIYPTIFRPIISSSYPGEYRPMLFQDRNGDVKGLVHAINEENLKHPVDVTKRWRREIEELMPEVRR